jgi:methyl-accepting chemotaxis protein
MDEVRSTMNEQQQKLNDTKAKFSTVIENVDVSRTETTNIKTDTSKCNEERKKVIDVISNLSAISEENAASTQETTASMQQLNEAISVLAKSAGEFKDMSAKLKEDVSFFKL